MKVNTVKYYSTKTKEMECSDKYNDFENKYLDIVKDKDSFKFTFDRLKNIKKFVTEWTENEVDEYLIMCHAGSYNTVNKYLWMARRIHEFVCEQLDIDYQMLQPSKTSFYYIDIEKFKEKTINKMQYDYIRRELEQFDNSGNRINYRNKLLVELAWEGLTNKEIKFLKEKDIEFNYQDGKIISAKLTIKTKNDERYVIIEDKEILGDLRKCINEEYFTKIDYRNKKESAIPYKISEYLIKPALIGTQSNYNYVANPCMLLNRLLKNVFIPWKDIDVTSLSLADIRRSRILWELTRHGTAKSLDELRSIDEISIAFGKSTITDIDWLRHMAQKTYIKKTENNALQAENAARAAFASGGTNRP